MKVKVIDNVDKRKFEEELEQFLNGGSLFYPLYNIISINYSYNRASSFNEKEVYSALIIYE